MIKPGALVMAAAMAAVSAGTYFGLDLLPVGLLPEPIGRTQKPEPPKPGQSAFDAAPATSTAAAAPAAPAEPAPAEQPVTEQDLAEEPPPPPAPAAAPAEPQAQAQAEPAPEPEPAAAPPPPKPAPKVETPPALRDQPAAPPAAKAAPSPAPAKPRPKVEVVREESPSTEVASAAPAQPKAPKAAPPDADVIKPWWPDSSKVKPNQLRLQYAGQVQGENAIALLFSAPLNLDALKQHAQVKTMAGQAVDGQWALGKNPQLAVFRGVDPGRYTVILDPEVADTKGFMLGMTLKGPVYIKPPQP
jgi:hypothetical protein